MGKVTHTYSKDSNELLLHIQEWTKKGYILSQLDLNNNQFKEKPIYAEFELIDESVKSNGKCNTITFEEVTRPVLKYLCENHHPMVSVIITPTTAELLESQKSIGEVTDYVKD